MTYNSNGDNPDSSNPINHKRADEVQKGGSTAVEAIDHEGFPSRDTQRTELDDLSRYQRLALIADANCVKEKQLLTI